MGLYRVKWKVILKVCRSLMLGNTLLASCKGANISVVTLWRWREKYPKLLNLLYKIYDSRTGMVEDALFANAIKGHFAAQQYFLNNRSHSRWHRNPEQPVLIDNSKTVIFHSKPTIIFQTMIEDNGTSRIKDIHAGESAESVIDAIPVQSP